MLSSLSAPTKIMQKGGALLLHWMWLIFPLLPASLSLLGLCLYDFFLSLGLQIADRGTSVFSLQRAPGHIWTLDLEARSRISPALSPLVYFWFLLWPEPVAQADSDSGWTGRRGGFIILRSCFLWRGNLLPDKEVCMAGPSGGHEGPMGSHGGDGASLCDGHCGGLWKERSWSQVMGPA